MICFSIFIHVRYSSIKINNNHSHPRKLKYGGLQKYVPQGSVISPILYAIYLLHLSSQLDSFPNVHVILYTLTTSKSILPRLTRLNFKATSITYTTGWHNQPPTNNYYLDLTDHVTVQKTQKIHYCFAILYTKSDLTLITLLLNF